MFSQFLSFFEWKNVKMMHKLLIRVKTAEKLHSLFFTIHVIQRQRAQQKTKKSRDFEALFLEYQTEAAKIEKNRTYS